MLKPRLAYLEGLGLSRAKAVAALKRQPELLGVDSAAVGERVAYLLG